MIGFNAGSAANMLARKIASKLTESPDRPVEVKLMPCENGARRARQVAGASFCSMTGVGIRLRVYKEESTALFADLEAGRDDVTFDNILPVLPLAQRGGIRMLAVTGATRGAMAPDTLASHTSTGTGRGSRLIRENSTAFRESK